MNLPAEMMARFEEKWSDLSEDYPICAHCGERVGSEEQEETEDGPDVAIRLWRDPPDRARTAKGEKQELAFHQDCAAPLLGLSPRSGPPPRSALREAVRAVTGGKLTPDEVEEVIKAVAFAASRRAMLFTMDPRWRASTERYFPVPYEKWNDSAKTAAHMVAQAIGWSIEELLPPKKEPK